MKLSRSVKIYLGFIFTIGSALLADSVINSNLHTDKTILTGVIFFIFLGAIAESLPIRVKSENLVAISSTVSIACILVFDVHTAVIIRFLAATLALQKGKTGYSHLFNRPLYKSLFNGFARGITVFLAGLTYLNISAWVPGFNFLGFNIVGLLGLVVVYFVADTVIFSILFSLLLNVRFRDEIADQLRTANQLILLAPFGVLLAGLYNWQGIFPIILFLGPLLFARHILEQGVQARQTLQDTAVLYQALSKITGTPNNEKSLTKKITEIIVNDFHAHKCAVWFLSDDHSRVIQKAYSGAETNEHEDVIPMSTTSLITTAIKTGENIYTPDISKDPRYFSGDESTLSEFVVPLQAYGEVIGVINMESPKLDDFSEQTRRLVTAFAQNATLALQNAKLVDSLESTIVNLREIQSRINFFLEHTAEGVYRIDYDPPIPTDLPYDEQFKLSIERGKIGECNDAIARMYGFPSRKEMLGTPYASLYGEEGYESNLDVNLDFYRQGYKSDDIETEEYTVTGEKVYFLNNVVGIIRDNYFVATWGTQRNITPLKKAIAELEIRNAELERFNYTLSHELKTPLITIRGFLGYVESNLATGNTERAKADIARIGNAADKMHKMIMELLGLARIGHLINQFETVSFEEIVREGINTVAGSINKHNVQYDIQANLPIVRGDYARLIEVIQILVDNATKYMGNQMEPLIEIGYRGNSDLHTWTFFVKDNGIGIDLAYHERIFGLFDKLDPQSEGSGIGLAMAKRIIETHGGNIWVESQGIGHGSTFYFTLPKEKQSS